MRVIETTVYKFEELSDKAKDRAIEKYQSKLGYLDFNLLDNDSYVEWAKEQGFLNAEIEYSGFSSQGDGASFMADIDTESFLVGKYECLKDIDFSFEIDRRGPHHYVHEHSKYVKANLWNVPEELKPLIEELRIAIDNYRVDLCHQIYKSLEADYEYQTSNEAISVTLIANEYEFDEQGNMV